MDKTPDLLFEYLKDIIYDPSRAQLDLGQVAEEYQRLAQGLEFFAQSLNEMRSFASTLAKGDLSAEPPPRGNELAAPLKALHASLRHITWQTQQVAKGDYHQRIDFMGEFSEAFNSMVQQLDARQKALQAEIELSKQKTEALSQSNRLLANITSSIPQIILVLEKSSGRLLFQNLAAEEELAHNAGLLDILRRLMRRSQPGGDTEICTRREGARRYLSIADYRLQWAGEEAHAFVITDVSADKAQIEELEQQAYQDSLTGLNNRFAGMRVFNDWLEEKRQFTICFVDLNNLKYVNDTFGHSEGDQYLILAADLLRTFSPDTMACRLGGDEFMLLIPGFRYSAAHERIEALCDAMRIQSVGSAYCASMSYGLVEVQPDNALSSSELLSIADERMYAHKRHYKKTHKMVL